MHRRQALRFRILPLVTALGLALAPLGAARAAAPVPAILAPRDAVTVTQAEVVASNAKVRMAYDDLVAMWGDAFARIGTRFAVPGLVRFRGGVRTGCGAFGPDNAAYCPADNRIYFDEVFVAAQAKSAARQVGTDGDMAAVGVIAHEMGHNWDDNDENPTVSTFFDISHWRKRSTGSAGRGRASSAGCCSPSISYRTR